MRQMYEGVCTGVLVLCVCAHCVCLCLLFKCVSGVESRSAHISLQTLIRHGQRHRNGKTKRSLGKEADSTSGTFCNAIFSGSLTKY